MPTFISPLRCFCNLTKHTRSEKGSDSVGDYDLVVLAQRRTRQQYLRVSETWSHKPMHIIWHQVHTNTEFSEVWLKQEKEHWKEWKRERGKKNPKERMWWEKVCGAHSCISLLAQWQAAWRCLIKWMYIARSENNWFFNSLAGLLVHRPRVRLCTGWGQVLGKSKNSRVSLHLVFCWLCRTGDTF